MKEKPILFSGPMVCAILDGSKTQTRRVMKPQPKQGRVVVGHHNEVMQSGTLYLSEFCCPYGRGGVRLWVRETWAKEIPGCPDGITYRADHQDPHGDGSAAPIKWRPSIHMPRGASRITLEITNVRAERLRDISEADARAEGATPAIVGADLDHRRFRAGFQALWEQINGPGSWDAKPWVWVVEFKRVD